jgi:hypothetical protein
LGDEVDADSWSLHGSIGTCSLPSKMS